MAQKSKCIDVCTGFDLGIKPNEEGAYENIVKMIKQGKKWFKKHE